MEYLVTMTTHVPEGTSEDAVTEVRGREAARSRELAAQGFLLRLWRPPLAPGEWRTLGLFSAGDEAALEQVLSSMPLRIWRTDDVTPLSVHPNDPGPGIARRDPLVEFFTTFVLDVPAGTASATVDDVTAQEAARTRELAAVGTLERLWKLPAADSRTHALGLWQATGLEQMDEVLGSLPMIPWLTVETVALSPHPSDPAAGTGTG
jgi:muconolactone delta-isomerase